MLAQGRVARGRYFIARTLRSERPAARLGIIAARKAIRRAVDRNTCKRIVRESFREHLDMLAGVDVVVVCRTAVGGTARRLARRELDALLVGLAGMESRSVVPKPGINAAADRR